MPADFPYENSVKGKQAPSVQVFGLPAPGQTQVYDLGAEMRDETTGTRYRYVKAGAIIAANAVVSSSSALGTTVITAAASAAGVGSRVGVSPQAFASGDYGFIVVEGPVYVGATSTGYVLGDPVAPDVGAAGKVIEHVVGGSPSQAEVVRASAVMGFALEVESGGLVKIFVQRCV